MKKALLKTFALLLMAAVLLSAYSCGGGNGVESAPESAPESRAEASEPASTPSAPEVSEPVGSDDESTVEESSTEIYVPEVSEPVSEPVSETPSDEEIYQIYLSANKKTGSLKNASYDHLSDFETSLTIEGSTETFHTRIEQTGKATGLGSDDLVNETRVAVTTGQDGSSVEEVRHFVFDKDNVYYREDSETEYTVVSRSSPEAEAFNQYMLHTDFESSDGYPEEAFSGAQLTVNEDGSKLIKLCPDSKARALMIDRSMGQITEAYKAFGGEMNSMRVNSCEATVTISPEGCTASVEVVFDMDMSITVSGYTMDYAITGKVVTNVADLGEDAVINIPENVKEKEPDESEWKEIDRELYELCADAVYKTNECDDIHSEAKYVQTVITDVGGFYQSTNVSTTESVYKCHGRTGEEALIEAHMSFVSEIDGEAETEQFDAYCDKDTLYYRYDPSSPYTAAGRDSEEAAELGDYINVDTSYIESLAPEAFTDAKITENSDGTKTVVLTIDDSNADESFSYSITYTDVSFEDAGAEDITHEIVKAEITIVIDENGYVRRIASYLRVKYQMKLSGYDVAADITMDGELKTVDPGQPVEITMPYEELSA